MLQLIKDIKMKGLRRNRDAMKRLAGIHFHFLNINFTLNNKRQKFS